MRTSLVTVSRFEENHSNSLKQLKAANSNSPWAYIWEGQERIKKSLHLQYKPYESTFARIFLFLECRGVLTFARTL